MTAVVEFLDVARRARNLAPLHASAAASYLKRAEDALTLLPDLKDLDDRAAVCQITETWLALAEAELAKD